MSKARPIHRAIADVLREAKQPIAANEIYERIQQSAGYDFHAKDPVQVVQTQLRRHCVGMDFPSARRTKYFQRVDGNRYVLLSSPVHVEPTAYKVTNVGRKRKESVVTVPPNERCDEEEDRTAGPTHTEMQWRLLDLGSQMGMSIWAPMNDRGRSWNGHQIVDIPRLLDKLPPQFDPGAMKTVSYIDVIWLEQKAIGRSGFAAEGVRRQRCEEGRAGPCVLDDAVPG